MEYVLCIRLFDHSYVNVQAWLAEVSIVEEKAFEHYVDEANNEEFRVEVGTNEVFASLLGAELRVGILLDRLQAEDYWSQF